MIARGVVLRRLLPAVVVASVLGASLLVSGIGTATVLACSYGYGYGVGYGLGGGPTVTEISNNEGPLAGGTTVTITGCGFTGVGGASGVRFGATNALRYTFVSDSRIVAVSPAHAAAVVDVTVGTNHGFSDTGPLDKFTFTGAKWCATYENLIRAPRIWIKGHAQTFTVTVSNCGTATWPMTGTIGRVDLNMHFTTKRGGSITKVYWLTRGVFHITRKLPTNRSTIITVTLTPTFSSSGLWLEALMIREGYYYFDQATHHPTQWSAVFVVVAKHA